MFPVVVMVYLHRSCGSIVLKRCGAYYFKANLVCLSRVMKSYCTVLYGEVRTVSFKPICALEDILFGHHTPPFCVQYSTVQYSTVVRD
jgi:hypothetical protein